MLTDVDHVGIAVEDLDAAVEHYRRSFGIEPVHRETVESQGVVEGLFRVGTSYIQLLGALGPETPVGRFLDRHGPGVHHIGYRVDDVAETLDRLRAAAVPLVDVGERGGDPALRHHGMGLAKQRLADQGGLHALRRGLDGRAQSRAAGADHNHVVFMSFVWPGHD